MPIFRFFIRLFTRKKRKSYRETILSEPGLVAYYPLGDVPDMWHNRNVAYYQLNEPSGTIAHDSSENDYHATLRVDDAPTNVALGDTDAQ